jgi:hypothetical protein
VVSSQERSRHSSCHASAGQHVKRDHRSTSAAGRHRPMAVGRGEAQAVSIPITSSASLAFGQGQALVTEAMHTPSNRLPLPDKFEL